MNEYDAHAIEQKWQDIWAEEHTFSVPNPKPGDAPERHFYMLEMLPYPSGSLHMGHVLNYTLGDVVTHFQRRQGTIVLRPMGFDSFGLPAENAAIKDGGHPLEITERNMEAIRIQMRRMGWAIDWDREVSAHEPTFYRWTQWLFLKFLEHGLAYRKEAPVNWCPNDLTVLSNEHVVDGRCWRCGAIVEIRNMEQWFFKIRDYADVLLDDLATIDWPERTKKIQTQHIGRSEGAEIVFRVDELDLEIPGLHDAAGHVVRRDVLCGCARVATGAAARRRQRRGVDLRAHLCRQTHRGARGAREERRLHGALRNEPRQRRAAADLGRRLRADGLRHGRVDGRSRARRPRPRVRRAVRPADRPGDRRRGQADQLGAVRRAAGRRGEGRNRRLARRAGQGEAVDQLPPARLELLAPALLGLPDSGRLLPDARDGARARGSVARVAAGRCRLPAEGEAAARLQPGLHQHDLSAVRRPGAARSRHDGHLRRLVVVLPALHRSAGRPGAVRPRDRGLLDADRPVHRRHRSCQGALALLTVFREGAERPGHARLPRALPEAVPPGLGEARRQADVEVAGRCLPERADRPLRRRLDPHLHLLPGACRPGHRLVTRRDRRNGSVRAPSLARRARGGRRSPRRRPVSTRRSRARRTRRSRGSPTTSGAASSSTRRSRR